MLGQARMLKDTACFHALLGRLLVDARATGRDAFRAIDARVGWDQLERRIRFAEDFTRSADDGLEEVVERYPAVWKLAPIFLADRNACYVTDPDVLFYTHVTDRFTPFHTKVIAANAGEAAHVLDGLLDHESELVNRLGELRDRTFENQRHRASGLTLVTAAVTLWDTVYLDRAVRHLRGNGTEVPDELLAHVASLDWEHVGLTGDYLWGEIDKPCERFRPLRLHQQGRDV